MKEINKGTRIINFLIDLIICAIIFSIFKSILSIDLPILNFIVYSTYYIAFEYLHGQTIGKIITKTKVVGINNIKPSFGRILFRTILRFNPLDGISYLFGNEQGTHDLLSKTKLISKI